MDTKIIEIGKAKFRASDDGRVWVIRKEDEVEIGTGDMGIYKKYFVKEVGKAFYLHRIIALAFIPNPKNKEAVNHIDGDRHNNKVENLEWVTHRENIVSSYKRRKEKKSCEVQIKSVLEKASAQIPVTSDFLERRRKLKQGLK
jgi:hypothetical protein